MGRRLVISLIGAAALGIGASPATAGSGAANGEGLSRADRALNELMATRRGPGGAVYSAAAAGPFGPVAVVAYGAPEEKVDVLQFQGGTWTKTMTLDPGGGFMPATVGVQDPDSCSPLCVRIAHVTDATVDFVVPVPFADNEGSAVLAIGPAGPRFVRFVQPPQSPRHPWPYVVFGALVDGSQVVSQLDNTCTPHGGCQRPAPQAWTYDPRVQAFLPGSSKALPQEPSSGAELPDQERAPKCDSPAVDVQPFRWVSRLNRLLAKRALQTLPISVGSIKFLGPLWFNMSPYFKPGEVKVCAEGLVDGGLRGEANAWDGNILSLGAEDRESSLGPFVYSADLAGWLRPDGLPASELSTKFGAGVEVSAHGAVDLSLDSSDTSFDRSITFAEVDLSAVRKEWTLVSRGHAVFKASLAPSLSLRFEISPRSLRNEILAELKEGKDLAQTEQSVVEMLSDDVVGVAEADGAGFYGLESGAIANSIDASLSAPLLESIDGAVEKLPKTDPILEPLEADVVPAEFDAALEADLEEATLERVLCVFLFLGPEDPIGDFVCLR